MEDQEIDFSVTPLYDVKPSDEDFESDIFEFNVEAIFTQLPDREDESEDDNLRSDVLDYFSDRTTRTRRRDTFVVERRADDETFCENVRCKLEALGFPAYVQPYLVERILHEAKAMEADRDFLGCKVIRIGFSIEIVVNNHDEDDVIDAAMVPASKSSIESLERVNIEGSNTQCSICFEEISAKIEVIRLPCLHVYHGQCIRTWLEKSGKCPLCRFVI